MAESTRLDADKPKTWDHGRERIALVLGGGAPTLTLQAGALLALDEEGVEFDVISTSGAGMLIGLLYAAPKGKSRRQALEATVELGVHDAIYNLFPINYKVFCKPSPFASSYHKMMMQVLDHFPKSTSQERYIRDFAHFCLAAWAPSNLMPSSLGMCEAAPWLEDVVDFDALKKFNGQFYLNAWNIFDRKMRVFNKENLLPAHFRAGLAFPLIYPPYELDGDFYIEGSAMDTLNLAGLLRYDNVFDQEYDRQLVHHLTRAFDEIERATQRGNSKDAQRLVEAAKKSARRQASASMKGANADRRRQGRPAPSGADEAAPPQDPEVETKRAKLVKNTFCRTALEEEKAAAKGINAIDRIVAFDVLGTEALVRQPRNLYDAWVLQMIVPLVSLANQEIAEFREDFESDRSADDRILHLVHFEEYVRGNWETALDWSYSNLSRLFEAGKKAGKAFYEDKPWLHPPKKPATS